MQLTSATEANMSTQAHNIQIDVLIVGQGPAGGSAGVFLSHLDRK